MTKTAWIENYSQHGFRFVDYADKINGRLRHQGYYLNRNEQSEVYRGIVLQIPGRKGFPVFIAGYADPYNDDCAFVELSPIAETANRGDNYDCNPSEREAAMEAARSADELARIYAEKECDYQEAWEAGNQYNELAEAIASERHAILMACKARKSTQDPTLRDICAEKIERALTTICEHRKERANLLYEYGKSEGFLNA